MATEIRELHVFFFPFMAHGHIIPTVDVAKFFASRGVKSTIITTPQNEPFISRSIQRSKTDPDTKINIITLKFPSAEVGLPDGCENIDAIPSFDADEDAQSRFFKASTLLQQPLELLLQEHNPDCLVSDMFFPWTTESAAKFNIPRLVFHGTCFFSLSATYCIWVYEPHKKVSSDEELFVIPHLPGDIKLTRKKIPGFQQMGGSDNFFAKFMVEVRESDSKSYGVIVNSFYELEAVYADFYRNFLGRKAWHIGPVSLCNKNVEDKAIRGEKSAIDEHECLKWLDSKSPNSVIYICFGSVANFTSTQLMEIATGIEASGQQFIWVVRKTENNNDNNEDWLPEGFEERNQGKGLVIRGWAPQVLILDHESVGGFVTHCGWNSTLEGITAGVPMVTWPVSAEQFYNEKLVTDVLRTGVAVGTKQWARLVGDFVKREKVEKAVREVMVGEAAEERRRRAKDLAELAKKAVQVGGSSYSDLTALIEELSSRRQ